MTSATEFENVGNQPPYSRINARWDAPDDELDNDSSSARLFERSRIKALAGTAWGLGGSEGHRCNPYQVHGPPCCAGASVVNSGIAGTGNLCHVQRAPFAQGVQASAACPRIPHILPAALRGWEMLAVEEGVFCHLSLSQVTWDQSQK